MRRFPWLGMVIAIIVVAVVIGGGLGWWVSRDNDVQTVKPVVIPEDSKTVTQTGTTSRTPVATASVAAKQATATASTEADTTSVEREKSSGENQWQEALDEVLTGEGEADQKADRLLRMLPHLKEEAQVEVSQHLVNFVADDHYLQVAQILTNASTLESVSSVLMTDLLNRNDGLKLPLLLSLARDENHPKHTEAKDLLELYLQENHGSNWSEWESSVTNYLAQNTGDPSLQIPPDASPEPTNP